MRGAQLQAPSVQHTPECQCHAAEHWEHFGGGGQAGPYNWLQLWARAKGASWAMWHVCHITLHASETIRNSRTSGQASLCMQLPAYPSMTHPIASGMIDPMHNLHMLGYSSSCGTSKPTHKANCVGDRLICWRLSALSHVAFSFCTGKVHVKLASSCQRALNGQPRHGNGQHAPGMGRSQGLMWGADEQASCWR